MIRFYQPDLGSEPDSPFARDANSKLIRRGYWLDMNDRSLVLGMTQGLGANLTNDEKRGHLADLKREHLIDQVIRCVFRRSCHLKECRIPPRYSGISVVCPPNGTRPLPI